jgi:hypothetical protein
MAIKKRITPDNVFKLAPGPWGARDWRDAQAAAPQAGPERQRSPGKPGFWPCGLLRNSTGPKMRSSLIPQSALLSGFMSYSLMNGFFGIDYFYGTARCLVPPFGIYLM